MALVLRAAVAKAPVEEMEVVITDTEVLLISQPISKEAGKIINKNLFVPADHKKIFFSFYPTSRFRLSLSLKFLNYAQK